MAKIADRVLETSTSSGTEDINLDGAVTEYCKFLNAFARLTDIDVVQ